MPDRRGLQAQESGVGLCRACHTAVQTHSGEVVRHQWRNASSSRADSITYRSYVLCLVRRGSRCAEKRYNSNAPIQCCLQSNRRACRRSVTGFNAHVAGGISPVLRIFYRHRPRSSRTRGDTAGGNRFQSGSRSSTRARIWAKLSCEGPASAEEGSCVRIYCYIYNGYAI